LLSCTVIAFYGIRFFQVVNYIRNHQWSDALYKKKARQEQPAQQPALDLLKPGRGFMVPGSHENVIRANAYVKAACPMHLMIHHFHFSLLVSSVFIALPIFFALQDLLRCIS
jgi:hypothetical protein